MVGAVEKFQKERKRQEFHAPTRPHILHDSSPLTIISANKQQNTLPIGCDKHIRNMKFSSCIFQMTAAAAAAIIFINNKKIMNFIINFTSETLYDTKISNKLRSLYLFIEYICIYRRKTLTGVHPNILTKFDNSSNWWWVSNTLPNQAQLHNINIFFVQRAFCIVYETRFVYAYSLARLLRLSTMIDYKRQTQLVLRHYVISKHITREFVINYHFRVKNIYTWISPLLFSFAHRVKSHRADNFFFLFFVSRQHTESSRHSRMKWRRLIWTYARGTQINSRQGLDIWN